MAKELMIISDLDGTLFRSDNHCAQSDYRTLLNLGDAGHTRVIATGRSLHSAHKVLAQDFPIDYLIFSSGAGLMNWKTKKIILAHSLNQAEVTSISRKLREYHLNFMLHYPIPENHHFVYHQTEKTSPDFHRRIDLYREFASPFDFAPETFGRATQFIAIVRMDEVGLYNKMVEEFGFAKVIRATSPLDHDSIWIEIFPKEVSKGLTSKQLCRILDFNPKNTVSIGNDFNDIDLLLFTAESWVVDNAPKELKANYKNSLSNNNGGFTFMVKQVLNNL